ncbi:hypothetical protein GGR50DRAFT_693159 [Xylaria sp. CBS 124048]|nr:hypothetical protein GGR50DRAFT_693159 [Xylaria sp. CBS 124048]
MSSNYTAQQWDLARRAVSAIQAAMPDDEASTYTIHTPEGKLSTYNSHTPVLSVSKLADGKGYRVEMSRGVIFARRVVRIYRASIEEIPRRHSPAGRPRHRATTGFKDACLLNLMGSGATHTFRFGDVYDYMILQTERVQVRGG